MGAKTRWFFRRFQGVSQALHKKSGQKSDSAVNKDFLVSFWRSFEIKKVHFGRKKHRQGTLFVQSRALRKYRHTHLALRPIS